MEHSNQIKKIMLPASGDDGTDEMANSRTGRLELPAPLLHRVFDQLLGADKEVYNIDDETWAYLRIYPACFTVFENKKPVDRIPAPAEEPDEKLPGHSYERHALLLRLKTQTLHCLVCSTPSDRTMLTRWTRATKDMRNEGYPNARAITKFSIVPFETKHGATQHKLRANVVGWLNIDQREPVRPVAPPKPALPDNGAAALTPPRPMRDDLDDEIPF
jgi:hypothetical protein